MSGGFVDKSSHANRGKPFEEALEAMHALYQGRGHSYARFPTPYKVIRRMGAQLLVVPEKPAEPDYLLVAHGLSIVADAKSTRENTWALSLLEEHQAAFFSAWTVQSTQHRAGVILQIHPEGMGETVWWIDWDVLCPVWHRWNAGKAARGQASLNVPWLVQNAVQVKNLDWLSAARFTAA